MGRMMSCLAHEAASLRNIEAMVAQQVKPRCARCRRTFPPSTRRYLLHTDLLELHCHVSWSTAAALAPYSLLPSQSDFLQTCAVLSSTRGSPMSAVGCRIAR